MLTRTSFLLVYSFTLESVIFLSVLEEIVWLEQDACLPILYYNDTRVIKAIFKYCHSTHLLTIYAISVCFLPGRMS